MVIVLGLRLRGYWICDDAGGRVECDNSPLA
jgi:hypothetical protein